MRASFPILAVAVALTGASQAMAQSPVSSDPFVNVFPHPKPPVAAPSQDMAVLPPQTAPQAAPIGAPMGAPRALTRQNSEASFNAAPRGDGRPNGLAPSPEVLSGTAPAAAQPSRAPSPYPAIPKATVPKSPEAQFAQCAGNSDATTSDGMLAACSAIIEAGREPASRMTLVYANRARAWHETAQYNAAIADFDQAIRLAPQNAEALQGRCMSRAVAGQLSQALADCNQALKLKPDNLAALESRGFTYRKMRAFNRSIADYDAVLQIDPKRASALFGRGVAKTDNGDRTGYADIKQAKDMQSGVAQEFGRYGIYR